MAEPATNSDIDADDATCICELCRAPMRLVGELPANGVRGSLFIYRCPECDGVDYQEL